MSTSPVAQALTQFLARNPAFDLHAFHRSSGDDLAWEGVDRGAVTAALRKAAPLRHAGTDPLTAYRIAEAGYASLGAVARRATAGFVDDLRGALEPEQARAAQARARGAFSRVVQQWTRLRESLSRHRRAYLGPRVERDAQGQTRSTPGVHYAALFGEAPLQDTPDAMSVFGPGAYFYDLMDLVDEEVTRANDQASSPLSLPNRRPDLWNLPLTIDTISDEVSQADLTREILESTLQRLAPAIATLQSGTPAGNLFLCSDFAGLQKAVANDGALIVVTRSVVMTSALGILDKNLKIMAGALGVTLDCTGATAFQVRGSKVTIEGLGFQVGSQPAVTVKDGALTLVNTLFQPATGASAPTGWAMQCTSGQVAITSSTFFDPSASPQPMLQATTTKDDSATFTLVSSILWATAAAPQGLLAWSDAGSSVFNLAYCDLSPSVAARRDPRIFYADTNFSEDPGFASDDSTPPVLQPLRLASSSPCVGRGANGSNVGASPYGIYAAMALAIYPFDTPFDVEVQSAVLALDELELSLPGINEAFAPFLDVTTANTVAVAPFGAKSIYTGVSSLGLGLGEVQLLRTPITDAATLAGYYGLASFDDQAVVLLPSPAGGPPTFTFPAADFARWAGLTLAGLRELVEQELSPSELAAGVQRGKTAWAGIPAKRWPGFFVNAPDPTPGAPSPGLALRTVLAPVSRMYPVLMPLSGVEPEATIPLGAALAGSFTLQLWLVVHDVVGSLYQARAGDGGGPVRLSWERGVDGLLTLRGGSSSDDLTLILGPAQARIELPSDRWTCLTTVFDATKKTVQVYVDGRRAALVSPTKSFTPAPGSTLALYPPQSSAVQGERWLAVPDVAVWGSALSSQQVAAYFAARPVTDDPGKLLGHWPMNDGLQVGNTLVNRVMGGPSGRLTGVKVDGSGLRTWNAAYLPGQRSSAYPGSFPLPDIGGRLFVETALLTGESDDGQVGLSVRNLDRVQRFVRLARRLQWSFAELDWAMYTALPGDDFTSLDAFDQLAGLAQLQDETGLSLTQLCALVGHLKPYGRGRESDRLPLFDLVYNRPPLAGAYFTPVMSQPLVVPATDEAPLGRDTAVVQRVATSLGWTTAELRQVAAFFPPLDAGTPLRLDWAHLTYLYRFRLLAGLFDLDVDGLVDLLLFAGATPKAPPPPTASATTDSSGAEAASSADPNPWRADFSVTDLLALTRVQRVAQEAGIAPAALRYLTTDPSPTAPDADPAPPPDRYQKSLAQRLLNGLPAIRARFRLGVAPVRVTARHLERQGLVAPDAQALIAAAVDQGDITQDGLVRAKLLALLPDVVVRMPEEAPTLSKAVAAAVTHLNDGASAVLVLIAPGTYSQKDDVRVAVDLSGGSGTLIIQSAAGAERTIFDGQRASLPPGAVLDVQGSSTGVSVLIDQLTIQNNVNDAGGALQFSDLPGVVLRGCRLLNATSTAAAAGGAAFHAIPQVQVVNCLFDSNTPAAIDVDGANIEVVASTLYDGATGAADQLAARDLASPLSIEDSIVWPLSTGSIPAGTLIKSSYWGPSTLYSLPPALSGANLSPVPPTDADHGDAQGQGVNGGDPGYATAHASPESLLVPFALAQVEVLRASLVALFEGGDLPLAPILRYLGPVANGIELLGEAAPDDTCVTYLKRVNQYLLLAAELELGGPELTLLLPDPSILAPTPSTPSQPGAAGTVPWIPTREELNTLARYLLLRSAYPSAVPELWRTLRDAKDVPTALARLFEWDVVAVRALYDRLPPGTPHLTATLDIARALALAADSGLGLLLLHQINARAFLSGSDGATPLLQAVSATDAAAGARLSGQISEMKRRMLTIFAIPAIDGVTSKRGVRVRDTEDLSSYLLTDVRMGGETTSSRVAQATLSLQLYVQRVRLGLEQRLPAVSSQRDEASSGDAPPSWQPVTTQLSDRYWGWMSSFPTWGANRRVFLYPENYLRPDLRKSKTPLFARFADAVDGAAITKEQIETLYKEYLAGLVNLATLRTMGAWYTEETGSTLSGKGPAASAPLAGETIGVYHFVGRSAQPPYAFFHRSYRSSLQAGARTASLWTPWERIGVDIASDSATPVVFRGQLYVFWAEVVFVPDTQDLVFGGHSKVQLRFTVRGPGGTWSPAAAPFPELHLPPDVLPVDPVWRRPYVLPTRYPAGGAATDALFVQYGDYAGGCDPFLFVLRQDGTVADGLRFSPSMGTDAYLQYFAFVAPRGPGSLGMVTKASFEQANGLPLRPALWSLTAWESAAPSSLKALAFSATTPSNKVYVNAPNMPAGHEVKVPQLAGGLAYFEGRYYAAWDRTGKIASSQAPYCSWVELPDPRTPQGQPPRPLLLSPGVASAGYVPQLTGGPGGFFVLYASSAAKDTLVLARLGSGGTWEVVRTFGGLTASSLSLTTIGRTVYGVYLDAGSNVRYFATTGADWTSGLLFNKDSFADLSQLVYWRGTWYLATTRAKSGVTLHQASQPSGPWSSAGSSIPGGNNPEKGGLFGLSLVATSEALFIWRGILPEKDKSPVVLSSKGAAPLGETWTTALTLSDEKWTAGSLRVSPLVRAPYIGRPGLDGPPYDLLNTPGDQPSVVPVGNQLGAAVVGTDGGDYLLEVQTFGTSSPNGEKALAVRQVLVRIDASGVCTLQAVDPPPPAQPTNPPQAPNFTFANFLFQRLDSSAALTLLEALSKGGVDALMAAQDAAEYDFRLLGPTPPKPGWYNVVAPPDGTISSSLEDGFGLYYRELFYFIPWLLAERLREAGRYAEAKRWLEYVFCPTDPTAAGPYERCAWLKGVTPESDLQGVASAGPSALAIYREDPFDASALADLRPSAYQKSIFLAYVQNLLSWGDELFSAGTREATSEAAQLYRFASDLLGPRPRRVPYVSPLPETYAALRAQHDARGGDELLLEVTPADPVPALEYDPNGSLVTQGTYFGAPDNPRLEGLWGQLDERLFRIRHGLDADGAPSAAPLFEPALDPTGLVDAAAASGQTTAMPPSAGLDDDRKAIDDAIEALESAKGLAGSVVDFGRSLLGTLEAKDADALATLQARQQTVVADQLRRVRAEEVSEARATWSSLQSAGAAARSRKEYYEGLDQAGLSRRETSAIALTELAVVERLGSAAVHLDSVGAYLLPNIFGMADGGMEWGQAVAAAAAAADTVATALGETASVLTTRAEYERRAVDWRFQARLAGFDAEQLDAELRAAALRVQAAELQYTLEATSLQQSQEVDQYYQTRFASSELYGWMANALADLYYQLYQLAEGAARTAQTLANAVTGAQATYVSAGGWDARRRGLLAGERLVVDLARMEQDLLAWQRAHPPVKSPPAAMRLSRLDPTALTALQTRGACLFDVTEEELDRAQPGELLRRIREVSVEFVGWAGEVVHGELTQLSGSLVLRPELGAVRFLLGQERSPGGALRRRLRETRATFSTESGTTAPLEALAGAPFVGRYRLAITPGALRLDLGALRDVVLRFEYEARDGGDAFRAAVAAALPPFRDRRWLDVAAANPDGWARLLEGAPRCEVPVDRRGFARNLPGRASKVTRLTLLLTFAPRGEGAGQELAAACDPWLPERALSVPGAGGTVGVELPMSVAVEELCRAPVTLRLGEGAGARSALRAAHIILEATEGVAEARKA